MARFKQIVVLTGAGISAESGLKTFRDSDGLWEGHKVEDVATPEAFFKDPNLVHEFYNARRQQLNEVEPNSAHTALADFAQTFDGRLTLITQNVDDLHERAGSPDVWHMHGSLLKARCQHCENVIASPVSLSVSDDCSNCQRSGGMRPDIVWFGEMPMYMDEIEQRLQQADLFVAIGTSGHVYPAAGFVGLAGMYGAKTVEINLQPSAVDNHFDEHHYGSAGELVPAFFSSVVE